MAYLHHYYELDSAIQQTRMQQRAQSYQIVANDIYKIFVSSHLLRRVGKDEGHPILSEVYAGTC
jgi:hypothetical protein